MSLRETLGTPPVRAEVLASCAQLVDGQVKRHGLMIKGAYATIKAIKKGFVPEVINALLDEWLTELQPFYDQWLAAAKTPSFAAFVVARQAEVAAALLAVTDRRAAKTSHGVAKSAYAKLRPSALQHVTDAVPELAAMVQRYMP